MVPQLVPTVVTVSSNATVDSSDMEIAIAAYKIYPIQYLKSSYLKEFLAKKELVFTQIISWT